LRWRIDKKYVDIFRGFLETNLRPVPPHDIIFPTKIPTSCNIWSKEVFINEREERKGELEWAYRHECGHLAAFPRTIGEDFKNFYRARDIIASRSYDVKTFTKYYPLIANIAYDLIIDTELIMNYTSIKEKARELLRKARSLPQFIYDALEYATKGHRFSWIEPDAPHDTIVNVYEKLRDVLEGKDETAVMALIGCIGCPSSGPSGSSSACATPMGGAKSGGSEGDGHAEQGSSGGSEERGRGKSEEGSEQTKAGEGANARNDERGRKSTPEGSGHDREGEGAGKGQKGEEGRGKGNGQRGEDKERDEGVGGRVGRDEGEEGRGGWPSPLDIDYGPLSYTDVLPVAAELVEEGEDINCVVAAMADYVESVNEWREKRRGGQQGAQKGGGQQGQLGSGAGFGRGPIDIPTLKELVMDAYVERCFSLPLQVLPRKEGFVGVLPRERSTIWRLGDPIDELDVVETVRSYGVLVPGHTAIRTREVPMVQRVGRMREGGADIVIIVDQSGSMKDVMSMSLGLERKWIAARNTALALLGWARYIGANVRLLTFSDTVVIDSGWVDARKVKEVAVNFAYHYYPINNTVLSEALRRVDRPNATVYIIGDFNLGDWQLVEEQLPRLASLNALLVLLLIGRECHVRMMAEMARGQGVKVRAYSVDSPKAMLENALRELKI
jgi:hypothetical protein